MSHQFLVVLGMVENLFVFGNGIGRSIDNDFFSLQNAMSTVWNDTTILDIDTKALIQKCLPGKDGRSLSTSPVSEEELDGLQLVVNACDIISEFEGDTWSDVWLSPQGYDFPKKVRNYLHMVASFFIIEQNKNKKLKLPNQFRDSLCEAIITHHANIATLNYDDLIYDSFTKSKVFEDHYLRDGFFAHGFDLKMSRDFRKSDREGWYLHLHGSPLFVGENGSCKKMDRGKLRSKTPVSQIHLVLTNMRHKMSLIEASEILSNYWIILKEEVRRAKNIVIMGYGGKDIHLNEALELAPESARIRIVERNMAERTKEDCEREWKSRINHKNIEVVLIDNILDFRDWVRA